MTRPIVERMKKALEYTPDGNLEIKRAILESAVRAAQSTGDGRWKTKFPDDDDQHISIEEQLEIIGEILGRRRAPAKPVAVKAAILGGKTNG